MDRYGFAPYMSLFPKQDYGYTDFTVFDRTGDLVSLGNSTNEFSS